MALPNIGPLVSLVGSVGFSILGLVVPICLEVVWHWYPKENEDEDDDECWDATSAAENGVGGGTVASVDGEASKAEAPKAEAAQVVGCETRPEATEGNEKTPSRHRRTAILRVVRHIKNIFFFSLAMASLAGGTYFNIREIMTLTMEDDSHDGPPAA